MASKDSTKAKKYLQKYREEYSKEWPCIRKSKKGELFAFCVVCSCDISVKSGGRNDIFRHIGSEKHREIAKVRSATRGIGEYFRSVDNNESIVRAETYFTGFLVEHNLPIASSDHVGPLFRKMFPDSKIAAKYSCARTKTAAIVNAMSQHTASIVAEKARTSPFSLATDGSNDGGSDQLYPVLLSLYDDAKGEVVQALLSLPALTEGSSTGENIFKVLDQELSKEKIPWSNCVAFAADNASVMLGKKKGVASFMKNQNSQCHILGCPCHMAHNTAEKAAKSLPIAIDEFLVDVYYYLEKSSKRLKVLKSHQSLCETGVKKILKYETTRWLSMGVCIDRLLEQWKPLESFFKEEMKTNVKRTVSMKPVQKQSSSTRQSSPAAALTTQGSPSTSGNKTSKQVSPTDRPVSKTGSSACNSTTKTTQQRAASADKVKTTTLKRKSTQAPKDHCPPKLTCSGPKSTSSSGHSSVQLQESRLTRIHRLFSSPQTRLYSFFLRYSNQIFHQINLLLQREEPCVHILHRELNRVLQELLLRFVKPSVVMKFSSDLKSEEYVKEENQKSDADLMIGRDAREYIKNMTDSEAKSTCLTKQDVSHFFRSVRCYYKSACDYILKTWPLNDKLLQEAEVVDIALRSSRSFASVEYFVDRFQSILHDRSADVVDKLEMEFAAYQVDSFSNTPAVLDQSTRVDKKWDIISRIQDANGCKKYSLLSTVMKAVLVIPHSNASCERVFSIVRKNKTDFRGSMSVKMLQSLLVEKIANSGIPCHQREYSKELLKKVKQSTYHSLHELPDMPSKSTEQAFTEQASTEQTPVEQPFTSTSPQPSTSRQQ